MAAHHYWFRSGAHSLLAHVDVPAQRATSGMVIVPPFGWEDICSYRSLRSIARGLSSKGVAVLRYELPGTGDSSGSALDSNLFAAWIQSVRDAVAELKATTGVESVSVLGVRLGATLALAAACSGTHIGDLILWGASATGRGVLRELRAFRNLEVTEYVEGEVPPPAPLDGLEVAGFLLSPQTESALEAFTALELKPLSKQRILLLSRDGFPHDTKLVQFLEKGGCQVTLKPGMGYQKMMVAPHEPCPSSPEIEQTIVDFLEITDNAGSEDGFSLAHAKFSEPRSCQTSDDGVIETVCLQPYNGGALFSILTQPTKKEASSDWGLLFMNAGGVRHVGPNRMWVEAARRWGARGIPSMRVDFERVGESDGDQPASIASLHGDDLVEQLGRVMDTMHAKLGCRRFIAIGLCSGAFAAFQSLIRDSAIRGAVLLNPRLFFWDPEVEPRRLAKRVGTGLADASYWRRLLRGEIESERIVQAARVALTRFVCRAAVARQTQIPAGALTQAWKQVERFGTRVTLAFADGEPLLQEMTAERQLPPSINPLIQIVQVGKTGHTFRSLWAQKVMQDLIDSEIRSTIQAHPMLESATNGSEGVSVLA